MTERIAIPVDDIQITDPAYMQDLPASRVSWLIEHFDIDCVDAPLTVSRQADGTITAVDGRARLAALRANGYGQHEIECWVTDVETQRDAARNYLDYHERAARNARRRWQREVHKLVPPPA